MTVMTRRLRSRKLTIFSALPVYLGGKRRLCPTIFREIDRIAPRRLWASMTFLDGFLGGGSVSLYAKAQGFRVVATDIAERGIVVGQALIENSRVKLTKEDILQLARDDKREPGRIERDYSPSVFTRPQARFLDRALTLADQTADRAKAALYRLLAIRVASLAHPMSDVRKGTIARVSGGEFESISGNCVHHYVDGFRLTRPEKLWEVAQAINAGVFQGSGEVRKASVLDELPRIEAQVFFMDPPYSASMSYERKYQVIDQMLEACNRETSPFSARDGDLMIDVMLEKAQHIPVWLLTFGNVVTTIDDLEAKMTRFGRATRAIEIAYQHLPAVATEKKKAVNRELLVIGWDEAAVNKLKENE